MNTEVTFYKMTGSGNDFVFLDGRTEPLADWPAERIRQVCDRRSGVGADGVVLLTPDEGGVRMVYFNADGSRADLCGNAALCSTRLAAVLGMAGEGGMQLHTDSGILETRSVGPGWAAELRLPDIDAPEGLTAVARDGGERRMARVTVGVPHLVVLVDDLASVNVSDRGRALRRHAAFAPEGVNVNFVGKQTEGQDSAWGMRTYERGVEGETLACGTGTVAVAVSLAAWRLARLPARIVSRGGNVFSVSGSSDDTSFRDLWLCGEGRLVFRGTLPGS